jgi:FkbM family methyltransferase
MRRIFIDCGAHEATSVEYFKKNYPQPRDYEIFSFEGNSNFKSSFDKYPDVNLEIALVWKDDGERTFYNNNREGSSVYESKGHRRGNGSRWDSSQVNIEKVKTIDLDRWIKENFSENDEIILKMDIEGAEYEVLNHMIENSSIKYINKLFVEWHCAKTKEISVEQHVQLLEGLLHEGLIPYHWSYTMTSLSNIAVSKRNIAREDKSDNNQKLKSFEQFEERYNVVCENFIKLEKQQQT